MTLSSVDSSMRLAVDSANKHGQYYGWTWNGNKLTHTTLSAILISMKTLSSVDSNKTLPVDSANKHGQNWLSAEPEIGTTFRQQTI